jgi:hypothetical protein
VIFVIAAVISGIVAIGQDSKWEFDFYLNGVPVHKVEKQPMYTPKDDGRERKRF